MSSDTLIHEVMKNKEVIAQFITNFTSLLTKVSMVGLDGLDIANLNELQEILVFSRKNNFNELANYVTLLNEAIKQRHRNNMVNFYLYKSNWFFLFRKQYDYMTISAEMVAESEQRNLKQSIILKEEIDGIFTPLKIVSTSTNTEQTNSFECQIVGIFQSENTHTLVKSMTIQEKLTFYDEIFYKDIFFGRHAYSNFFNLNIQNYSEYLYHTFYLTKFAHDESSSALIKLINSQIQTLEEPLLEFLDQDLLLPVLRKYVLNKDIFLALISRKQEILTFSSSERFQLHCPPLIECLLYLNFTEVDSIQLCLISLNPNLSPVIYDIFALNNYDHWVLIDFDPFSVLPSLETILTAFYPLIDKLFSTECSVTDLYIGYLFLKISATTATNINKNLFYSATLKNKLLTTIKSFIQTLTLPELEKFLMMATDIILLEDLTPVLSRYIEIINQLSSTEQNDPNIQLLANYFIFYCIKYFNKNTHFLSFYPLLSKSLLPVHKAKNTQLAYFIYKSNRDAFIDFSNFKEHKFIIEWNSLWSKRFSQDKGPYEKIFLYKVNQFLYRYKIFVNSTDARIRSLLLLSELIKNGLLSSIPVLEELYCIYNLK